MSPLIKICGITNLQDAQNACYSGAAALGFVFTQSQRQVSCETAKVIVGQIPTRVKSVGVFANESLDTVLKTVAETNISGVQLHGLESPAFVAELRRLLPMLLIFKAIGLMEDGFAQDPQSFDACNFLLFDSTAPRDSGVQRQLVHWQKLVGLKLNKPFFVAGGLRPDNVSTLLQTLHADGLDVSSGIESAPGKKDLQAMMEFFKSVGGHHD
jgi:phosphoribosylanthranilate isomerase